MHFPKTFLHQFWRNVSVSALHHPSHKIICKFLYCIHLHLLPTAAVFCGFTENPLNLHQMSTLLRLPCISCVLMFRCLPITTATTRSFVNLCIGCSSALNCYCFCFLGVHKQTFGFTPCVYFPNISLHQFCAIVQVFAHHKIICTSLYLVFISNQLPQLQFFQSSKTALICIYTRCTLSLDFPCNSSTPTFQDLLHTTTVTRLCTHPCIGSPSAHSSYSFCFLRVHRQPFEFILVCTVLRPTCISSSLMFRCFYTTTTSTITTRLSTIPCIGYSSALNCYSF